MKEAVVKLIERLLGKSDLAGDDLLWTALAIVLGIASVHLLAMLVTRWGQRSLTPKAFFFSLLVHVSFAFALVTIQRQVVITEAAVEEPLPIPIKEIYVRGEDQFMSSEKGNSPVWEQTPEITTSPLIRSERQVTETEPPASELPERQTETPTRTPTEIPDLATLPDELKPSPAVDTPNQAIAPREAEDALKVEEKGAERRAEPQIASRSNNRAEVNRPGQIDADVTRDANASGTGPADKTINRSTDDIAPEPTVRPDNVVTDAKPALERDGQRDATGNSDRSAPTAVPEPESTGGAYADERPARPGLPTASRTSRAPATVVDGIGDGSAAPARRATRPGTSAGNSDVDSGTRDAGPPDVPRGNSPQPIAARPNLDGDPTGKFAGQSSTYRLRGIEKRKESAKKYGGTDASERAVELSLRWLAENQTSDGYWDSEHHGGGNVKPNADGKDSRGVDMSDGVPGKKADAGVTALSILAFLGAGYTHEEGQYAENVEKALQWLIRNQRDDGFLGGDATYYESMYCHAMATYAMAEAYGMQSDPSLDTGLRGPLSRAVNYILTNQNPDGGWRYRKPQISDMSMFGWQLMALKSADIAGIKIPDKTVKQMRQFLIDRSLGDNKGLAGYAVSLSTHEPMPPSPSMTAEALFCKQMLGINRSSPACAEAVDYLLQRPPKRSETNLYYWYYATLAMYQYGGKEWLEWNAAVRDELVATQNTGGEMGGSWDPKCVWGPYGGRIYSTAVSTLCLEVYYRFLPLYNLSNHPNEGRSSRR